jgi:hypothetical protein
MEHITPLFEVETNMESMMSTYIINFFSCDQGPKRNKTEDYKFSAFDKLF